MPDFNRTPVPGKPRCLTSVVCPPKNDLLAMFDFASFAPRHSIAPV
ncbi:hypothetical protein RBSWK_06596 [Rhodopirellula baltica SWK14]|uniref:Uncharacterized protein n=1 Tax=Rhodopirellula baltica SWK14 TaxID=993516 RepID=L7C5S1_RHOBT|nr:hypothetical protein RBSWK_06596 [Rhodopirellula baltica SWK14]